VAAKGQHNDSSMVLHVGNPLLAAAAGWEPWALSRSLWKQPGHDAGVGNQGLRGKCLSLAHSR